MDIQTKDSVESTEISNSTEYIEQGSWIRSIGMSIVEYGTGLCLLLVLIGYFLPLDHLGEKGCIMTSISEINNRFNSGEVVYGVWITVCLIVMLIGYCVLWGAWRTTIDYVCNRGYKITIY